MGSAVMVPPMDGIQALGPTVAAGGDAHTTPSGEGEPFSQLAVLPRPSRLVVGQFRDAGDAVQGEGANLLVDLVEGGDEAALDADGFDDALAGRAVRVDVADPDGVAGEDGGLEGGQGLRGRGAGERPRGRD